MKKQLLLLCAVLAVAAVAVIAWMGGRSRDSGVELARPQAAGGAPQRAEAAVAELAADATEPEAFVPGTPAARVETPAEDLAATWNPERTRWLEGRVALPPALPADEELAVYAGRAGRFEGESVAERPAHLLAAVRRHVDRGRKDLGPWLVAQAPVEPDGSFRIGLPPDGEGFELVALGRYTFTPVRDIEPFAPDAEDVLIEASLGAWVRGRVRVPEGAAIERLEGLAIELDPDPFSMIGFLGGGSVGEREVELAADGTFEVRGLVPGISYRTVCTPEDFAAHYSESVPVAPGQRVDVDVALLTGGVIEGLVRDADGAGVAGARIQVLQDVNMLYGQRGREVRGGEAGADGRFALSAVAAGRAVVQADADSYLEVSQDVRVPEGGRVANVELVLSQGATVAGEVRWPDGAPASDAEVTLGFDMSRLGGMEALNMFRGADGSAQTDADGRFAIRGLGRGPFAVRARAFPRDATAEEREADLVPRWLARADGVAPDTTDLVLELAEPLGVRGRVVDGAGEPVTKFAVYAIEITGGMIPGIGAERESDRFEDPEGRFFLGGLQAGPWNLSAVAEDYSVPTAVEITVPQAADAELVLTLERGASVAGIVLDSAGQPIGGARVAEEITLASLRDMTRSFVQPPEAITEADGSFQLEHLTPGGNTLVAAGEDHAPSAPLALDLASGEHFENAVLTLRVGARLTGEVYGNDGKLDAGIAVIAQVPGSIRPRAATTDAQGFFELDHLVPGTYQVIARGSAAPASDSGSGGDDDGDTGVEMSDLFASMKMASAELEDGEEVHVVLGAPPEDPVHVEGRVLCGGEELVDVVVSFMPEGGGGFGAMKFTNSAKDGSYALDLDQPGTYLVSAQRVGAMGAQNTYAENVEVPETESWEHDIDLPVGGIRGRVRAPDGSPASGARVSLNDEGPIDSGTIMGKRYTELATDEDGTFAIEWVPPGTYTVAVGGAPLGGLLGSEGAFGRQVRTGVSVRAGDWVEGVDFRLREPATVEGRVRDSSGQPVAEAAIFVRDEQGLPVERLSMLQTDGAGRFSCSGLSPGEYTVFARHGALVSQESGPVRAVAEGSSTVELRLEEGAFLVVQLEEGVGEPIQASVSVTDDQGRQVNGMLSLSELLNAFGDGFSTTEQRVGPLAPGNYRVAAFAPDGREASKPVTLRPGTERRLKLRLRD